MNDYDNHELVSALSATIDEQFDKFKAAHGAFVVASADDDETSVIEDSYTSHAANYMELK